jgi:hypothetical protein
VTLALSTPTDARRSPGVGCGQVDSDLVLPTEKALVQAFADAGASLTVGPAAPWSLSVAVTSAGVGSQYAGSSNRTARPTSDAPRDLMVLGNKNFGLFNSGNGHASVTLEATLAHKGAVVWRGNVTGNADSVPCTQVQAKTREALGDAVLLLRRRVLDAIPAEP